VVLLETYVTTRKRWPPGISLTDAMRACGPPDLVAELAQLVAACGEARSFLERLGDRLHQYFREMPWRQRLLPFVIAELVAGRARLTFEPSEPSASRLELPADRCGELSLPPRPQNYPELFLHARQGLLDHDNILLLGQHILRGVLIHAKQPRAARKRQGFPAPTQMQFNKWFGAFVKKNGRMPTTDDASAFAKGKFKRPETLKMLAEKLGHPKPGRRPKT
jgi:hypothetical protein